VESQAEARLVQDTSSKRIDPQRLIAMSEKRSAGPKTVPVGAVRPDPSAARVPRIEPSPAIQYCVPTCAASMPVAEAAGRCVNQAKKACRRCAVEGDALSRARLAAPPHAAHPAAVASSMLRVRHRACLRSRGSA
jgi:hypothetical protein